MGSTAELREASHAQVAKVRSTLFKQQLAFIDDPAREKAELCTRRAGKTTGGPAYARIVSLRNERSLVRIWGVTRLRAKELFWQQLKDLDARCGIEATYHDGELKSFLPNGSEIRLLGADKDKEVQKKRGDKTWLEIITETQLFGPYLKTLVEDVAGPCTFDVRGTLALEGTPGVLCAGHWHSISGDEDRQTAYRWTSRGRSVKGDILGAGWSLHRWSVLDNPYLPHARDELAALKAKRGWADDNPTYRREWLAQWVNDTEALFYRFDVARNTFPSGSKKLVGPGWCHVLGWDLGLRDEQALVVWGFHPSDRKLYEAFSWKKAGALLPEVMDQITSLEARGFNIIAEVADTGGGGALTVAEVNQRYGRSFEAAKKSEKYAHVTLFNDDLLTGNVVLEEGSVYASEIAVLPKDPDWPEDKPPREDPRFANHAGDAGLYGWRRAYNWLHKPEVEAPKPGTPEFYAAEERRMLEARKRQLAKQKSSDWWEAA